MRFTQAQGSLYVTLMETPDRSEVEVLGLKMVEDASVHLLGRQPKLVWRQTDSGVVITLPGELTNAPAHALKIAPAPMWVG